MILTVDIETTTSNKGNAFDRKNRIVNIGWKCDDGPVAIAYMDDSEGLERFKQAWKDCTTVVAFNAKFELHWLRRVLGLQLADNQTVYDPQLSWFVLTNQQNRYPSLNQVSEYFGLGSKHDKVAEFWKQGIDTPDIPREILDEYLERDVELTYKCLCLLKEQMPVSKRKLVQLQMYDLIVLADMEFHGLLYDKQKSLELATETSKELTVIDNALTAIVGIDGINFNSNDQLSAVLYGGTIVQEHKEDYLFQYKDVRKPPVIKQRKVQREYPMPRLVEPIPKTKLKKDSQDLWATNEPTLRSLKAKGKAKQIIDLILKRAVLEKLVSSYYAGIPKIMKEMDWPDNEVHGNFNQCSVVTGRLSSDKPNLQNLDKNGKKLFYSRYK